MRLLVVSDLHLEWGEYVPPPAVDYDAVVLAGDICQGPPAVDWARMQSRFADKPVVLVPGNHEYYGLEFTGTRDLMRRLATGSNVHVLDRDEFIVEGPAGDAVRFLGATLWTDFAVQGPDVAAAMDEARESLNDLAGRIRLDEGGRSRRFMPEDSVREHMLSRSCGRATRRALRRRMRNGGRHPPRAERPKHRAAMEK